MLRLDSVELVGFKSFAEKSLVPFNGGITCVIGPNGCGKSNLADAIGWVLGVQNAQSLRGERMDDLIFAGTRQRKPSGYVEARLSFSRSDGHPIELPESGFADESLEIARKLYRSGESTYTLNQRRCRLKDVHAVLEEAGLGFSSYALIAQGKIGWILSAKALERRAIIEEAARVTGYKSRRRGAELKLEMARQNLLRVNDIILEIERQLRSLKRQAAKARRYDRLRREFRELQRLKFVFESQQLGEKLEQHDSRLEQLKAQERALRGELQQREQEHQEALRLRDELEGRLSELRRQLSDLRLAEDRARNSITYHREQIEATRCSLEVNASEERAITESLEKVGAELSRFESERSALDEEEQQIETALARQTQLVDRTSGEMGEAERHLDELREQLVRMSADAAALNNLKQQVEQSLQSLQAGRERLEKERSQHQLQLEETARRLGEIARAVAEQEKESARLGEQLETGSRRRQTLERELDEIREEVAEIQSQLIAQRERLHSLQEIELSHSQYSEGVQKLLTHLAGSERVRAGGTLADFIETSPEFERLVEEFLDEELEYILVDSLEQARQGVTELKSLEGGKCTFMTINSSNGFDKAASEPVIEAAPEAGVYGTLGGLLHMSADVERAFQRAMPARAQAIVVSNLDRAVELAHSYPESTFITLEGEALKPRGLLSASAARGKKLGLLTLKRQKRDLETAVGELQKQLARVREIEGSKLAELEAAELAVEECEQSLHRLEKDLIGQRHRREGIESEKERQAQALAVVTRELAQLQQEEEESRRKKRSVEDQLDSRLRGQVESEKMVEEARRTLEQLKTDLARMQEQVHLIASDQKVLGERRTALGRTLERIEEQRSGLEARRRAARRAQQQGEERIREMGEALKQLEIDLREYEREGRRLDESVAEGEDNYQRWKAEYPAKEKRLAELREQRSELQDRRSQVDVELARLDTHLQTLEEQCRERLQMSLQDAARELDPEGISREESLEQFETLRVRLEKFGPINMAALEEYQEAEERHGFLLGQRTDIEASIADTSKAIQDLNRRSRRQFVEAFEAINGHFTEIFSRLFGGGECGMRLLDEDDILESGLDIFAQPPGKKLQHVSLLSGGEKAMTVFALLMALFKYRPSRFCVLDEVDAPLDDLNVSRFVSLVEEMNQETQFIIVTHNKRTMEKAGTLYGVTMEEPGVSKVVSVRF